MTTKSTIQCNIFDSFIFSKDDIHSEDITYYKTFQRQTNAENKEVSEKFQEITQFNNKYISNRFTPKNKAT